MAASTLVRLIDHAERALREAAVGRELLPSCAYIVDGGGGVLALALPVPDDDGGRDALAALLAVQLSRIGGRMWVLALPTRRRIGGRSRECALLDGQALGRGGLVRRSRLLRVERHRGTIAGLHGERTMVHPARPAARHFRSGALLH